MRSRLVTPALCLALLALVAATFAPGLSGSFLFDDFPNIVTNPRVHAEQLDMQSIQRAARAYEPGAYGRPLATISFAADHAAAGLEPRRYKLTSLIVHLVNTLLVFLLVRRVLSLQQTGGNWSPWAPALIALAWAAHPLQVSTVLYVVQRMEMLSATFVLLSLLTYLAGRQRQLQGRQGWHLIAAAGPLAAVGLLGKESAVLMPLFALTIEVALLRFKSARPLDERLLKWGYGAGSALAAIVFLLIVLPTYSAPEIYSAREFSLTERLLTQLRVLPLYLWQSIAPLGGNLVFYYDNFSISRGMLTPPTTLLGAVFLAVLAAISFQFRHRMPLFALGVAWFFAAHALTSNVVPLELVFEHRNYLALLGVLLALADLVRQLASDRTQMLRSAALVSGLAVLAFLTALRSAAWGDPLHLAMELSSRNPTSARASNDLGEQFLVMADGDPASPFFSMAMQEFERGSRLPGSSPLPEQALIVLASTGGIEAPVEWWDSLDAKIRTRPLGAQELSAVTGLLRNRVAGRVELDDDRLRTSMQIVLSRTNLPAHVHALYGDFLMTRLGDQAGAEQAFLRAVDAGSSEEGYALRLAEILLASGWPDLAGKVIDHAEAGRPALPAARTLIPPAESKEVEIERPATGSERADQEN